MDPSFRWHRGGRRTAAEKSRVTGLDGEEGEEERKNEGEKDNRAKEPPPPAPGEDRRGWGRS